MDQLLNSAHPLGLTTFPAFIKYIIKNRKDIKAKYYPQVLLSGVTSLVTSPFCLLESLIYEKKETQSAVKAPLFVLGHWRCGTTLLHQILSRDPQFGFIKPLVSLTLHFYHLLGWAFKPTITAHLHEGRPMDNIKYSMDLPLEEYLSFSTFETSGVYPLNYFPQAFIEYNMNAYVDQFPEAKRRQWIKSYDRLLRKVTYFNDGKSLVLKSPDNTARVRLLKELYPDAKFVNIYRNPYTVIRSTMHLYDKMMTHWSLEEIPPEETMEDWIIETFKMMYKAYFKEIQTLPPHSLFEIKFEDFERAPLPILKNMYEALELDGFDKALPEFKAHWDSLAGYQKNSFDYSERLVKKVNDNLGFYFDHYGYERKRQA
ncbi:sulfotransferase [bacterium]|nr:sulfotransferase [bacterium]